MGTVVHTALVQAISDSSSSLSGRPSLRRPLQRTPEFFCGLPAAAAGIEHVVLGHGVMGRLKRCELSQAVGKEKALLP